MVSKENNLTVYLISDFTGKTAETVINSVAIQFNINNIRLKKFSSISNLDQLTSIINQARDETDVVLAYTLVLPELCDYIEAEADKYSIATIDIMGPLLNKFSDILDRKPKLEVGLSYKIDQQLYQKISSINFTSRCDEGKSLNKLKEADYILIGVSRTSKTPLSVYLSNQDYKVANFSLSADMTPPQELYQLPANKVVGLTVKADVLQKIRENRISMMDFDHQIGYTNLDKIKEEIMVAENIMQDLGCKIIDISYKSIEEVAKEILD